jgi:hypothetical protein
MESLPNIQKLESMKNNIESMSKNHHIEILKIIKNNSSTKLNENKSGVYINLTFLPESTINEISNYLNYVNEQESLLDPFEKEKSEFKNTYFNEKENKDEVTSIYSYLS